MNKTITNTEYKQIIAKIIRARQMVGLRQVDVARKLRRPQSYISRLESGEYRIDILELKTLAKLYKKDIRYFI